MTGFQVFAPGQGEQARDGESRVSSWLDGELPLDEGFTHMGYVFAGAARLRSVVGEYQVKAGMYFALPGAGSVAGGSGIVLARGGCRGLFLVGGPIEERGRLRYIDGCTDTLLVPPVRRGDPCLNLLCFPAGTDQTRHTHPSLRAGVVARGHGTCRWSGGETPLAPGQGFCIPPGLEHAFSTAGEPMAVIAWHPDSDTGPSDDDHPMINRTYIGGVSAARLTRSGR
jgi:quercetin dioxygenase-like cupin family protein